VTPMQHEPEPTREDCQEAVDQLLTCYGWRLLERDAFTARTWAHVRTQVLRDAARAAKFVYSEALYAACSGMEGTMRREQGYAELHRWLYDVAYHRYGDLAEDVTQQALLATYASFSRCRQAGTFMMFTLLQLREAAHALRRQAAAELAWREGEAADGAPHAERVPDAAPSPEALALHAERRAKLEQCRAAFLRQHPRAAAQFAAVWLKFILGINDHEISRRLGKPIDHIYVLRARGLRKLQSEPQWRDLASDLSFDVGVA
jgi:DNA-directed RNA polymerase specialized sigma24 family protein